MFGFLWLPAPTYCLEFCLEIYVTVLSVRAADDLDDLKNPEVTGLDLSPVSPCFSDSITRDVGDEGEIDVTETVDDVESFLIYKYTFLIFRVRCLSAN